MPQDGVVFQGLRVELVFFVEHWKTANNPKLKTEKTNETNETNAQTHVFARTHSTK